MADNNNENATIAQPDGYKLSSTETRTQWNGFLDYLNKEGLAGNPNLDKQDVGLQHLDEYKKLNPQVGITPDMIPHIQYEQQQLRQGNSFGEMPSDHFADLKSGMSPNYLNRSPSAIDGQINAATSMLYYPSVGKSGTDIEGYYKNKMPLASISESPTVSAKTPSSVDPLPISAPTTSAIGKDALPAGTIPKPDYNNQTSRNNYLKLWAQKYGDLQGRGDTVLRVNEMPKYATHSAKEMAVSSAKSFGIDPALLYSSAMEEGMSGMFPDKKGYIHGGYQAQPQGYPVDGNYNFGLDNFHDFFPDLVKKGYLPKNFDYKKQESTNEQGKPINSAFFKNVEDAVRAKAAVMKMGYDYIDEQAKKHNIELSKNGRDFFSLAWLNGGPGGVLKRLVPYSQKGYLEDDKFMKKRPLEEEGVKNTNSDVWGHIVPRLIMRDNLKKEGHFAENN